MIPQNISQVQEGGLSVTTEDMKKEQYGSKGITVAPASLFSARSVREATATASSSYKITGTTDLASYLIRCPYIPLLRCLITVQ